MDISWVKRLELYHVKIVKDLLLLHLLWPNCQLEFLPALLFNVIPEWTASMQCKAFEG